jgi:hypothetical protein
MNILSKIEERNTLYVLMFAILLQVILLITIKRAFNRILKLFKIIEQ